MTTDIANSSRPESGGKKKQRMARITAKTQDSLLPTAAASYPRHSQAELIEKGLEALIGTPQPIVYFLLQDPDLQIQLSALLAGFLERLENLAKAVTRARFSDPDDQKAARTATQGMFAVIDEIRFAIKGVSEDANQIQKLVAALSRLLPGANALAARLRGSAAFNTKAAAISEGAGDAVKAKKQSDLAARLTGEAIIVEEIIGHLTSPKSVPPRP